MFRWLLPKTTDFYNYFEKHAALILEAANEFTLLVSPDSDIVSHEVRIKVLEVEADNLNHQCIESLHKTFITPFDRYYIYQLMDRLDDIIDNINETAAIIVVYKLTVMTPEVVEFATILEKATEEVQQVIIGFRHNKNINQLRQRFTTIKEYEKDSDTLLRKAIGHLFESESDAKNIIKWKEIYQRLEQAINDCQHVSNIVEGVILELS